MNEDKIMRLKAELFDLQVALGHIRAQMDEKLKELNVLQREKSVEENPRIS